jgi:hypothetical protein
MPVPVPFRLPGLDGRGRNRANPVTGRTPRGGNGRFTRTAESRRHDNRAAELRGQGYSFQRIADELGFASKGHAHDAVMRAYADIPSEGAEHARQLDLERIDRLIEQAWTVMLTPHLAVSNGKVVRRFAGIERDDDGIERLDLDGKPIPVFEDVLDDGPKLAAIREIRGLLERRAKITGYEAPARSRIEVVTPETIEAHIAALEAELARNDAAGRSPA